MLFPVVPQNRKFETRFLHCHYPGLKLLNTTIMLISAVSSWKAHFLQTPKLEFSNSLLKEIHQSVDISVPFFDSVKEISKYDGIHSCHWTLQKIAYNFSTTQW